MTKIYYAREVFPYIEIDAAYTLDGFLSHRTNFQRKHWGQVLSGSTEELIDACVKMGRVSPENSSMTEAEVRKFYEFCISTGKTEWILTTNISPNNDILLAFREGLKAND